MIQVPPNANVVLRRAVGAGRGDGEKTPLVATLQAEIVAEIEALVGDGAVDA